MPPPAPPAAFPLRIEPGQRYIVDNNGQPFLLQGDTPWSIVGQLTNAQINEYLDDRMARGFTAILFNAPEAYYTNQTPSYLNVDGEPPFSPMTNFKRPNERYWTRVDHLVNGAKARGIVCVVNPAYLGYQTDGWLAAIESADDGDLQTYGRWLAQRYDQGNIIWSLGGDHDTPPSLLTKQWNIALGLRSVRTTDIITAHQMSEGSNADDAYTYWSGYAGFNLNWVYGYETNGKFTYLLCAQAYSRPMPFVGFEFKYEGSADASQAMLRRQSYVALLSGACGQFYGNNPVWHFGSQRWHEPYSGTWQSNLAAPGAVHQSHVKTLFGAYSWWKLSPVVDATLVTSGLGTGANRIYAALASDRSFAFAYVPTNTTVTLNLVALAPAALRIRLYDPTRGTFAVVGGGTFTNAGDVDIVTGGERVIVVDAA